MRQNVSFAPRKTAMPVVASSFLSQCLSLPLCPCLSTCSCLSSPRLPVSILDRPEGQLEMIHSFLCLTPGPCPANCGAIDLIHENQKYQRNEFRSTGMGIKASTATSLCAASPCWPKSAGTTTRRCGSGSWSSKRARATPRRKSTCSTRRLREPETERAAESLGGIGRTMRTSVRRSVRFLRASTVRQAVAHV